MGDFLKSWDGLSRDLDDVGALEELGCGREGSRDCSAHLDDSDGVGFFSEYGSGSRSIGDGGRDVSFSCKPR